jgi:hypothetical protein
VTRLTAAAFGPECPAQKGHDAEAAGRALIGNFMWPERE